MKTRPRGLRFAVSTLKKRCLQRPFLPERRLKEPSIGTTFPGKKPVAKVPSHRILAVFRGEKEGFLDLRLRPPEEEAVGILEKMFVKGESAASQQVKEAVQDSYKRLLSLSMETEMRGETKERADREAIKVFAENLRELLLAAPLGQKNVMAIDPGIRTGCKVACLDRQGKLLHTDTIYPFDSEKRRASCGGDD